MGKLTIVCGAYTHLDDVLALQHQSIDWNQHTQCFQLGEPFGSWYHEWETSHEISQGLDLLRPSLDIISRTMKTILMNEHHWGPHTSSPSYIDTPMVHTRDREPVAQVVRRWLDL